MIRRAIVVALALAGCSQREVGEFHGTPHEGRAVVLVTDVAGDRAAAQALADLDRIVDPAIRVFGARDRAGKPRVQLYAGPAAFERADRELADGRFKKNLAFASLGDASAHVLLQPEQDKPAIEELGLPFLTRLLLCEEAAHLLRPASPGPEPEWLAHGAARWIAVRALFGDAADGAIAQCPALAFDVQRARALLSANVLPTVGAIAGDRLGGLTPFEREALQHLFFEFAMRSGAAAKLFAEAASDAPDGSGDRGRLAARVLAALEADGPVDARFRAFVAALPVEWDDLARTLEQRSDGTLMQTAFFDSTAEAFRVEPAGVQDYVVRATVSIYEGHRRSQVNLLLARRSAGWISIALRAGEGVGAWLHHPGQTGDAAWRPLGFAPAAELPAGREIRLAVRVTTGRIAVDVDGARMLEVEIPADMDLSGAVGIGAQGGSIGVWRDLAIEKLRDR